MSDARDIHMTNGNSGSSDVAVSCRRTRRQSPLFTCVYNASMLLWAEYSFSTIQLTCVRHLHYHPNHCHCRCCHNCRSYMFCHWCCSRRSCAGITIHLANGEYLREKQNSNTVSQEASDMGSKELETQVAIEYGYVSGLSA